ncbi:hypothetical protein GCM10007414_29850 [Agarivorans gilvus]|uniref:Uncharacterized protein n=2 Tax=Agarivorans gilvus TaxID=680279 RepID=A0ABQ1I447_9ALTE|nr:hypothetical protein GCM10007414_29850 [Agarivorans gilvus]
MLGSAWASVATIVAVEMTEQAPQSWQVAVSVLHDDSGWEHYADKWRVLDPQGRVLAERVLLHPHVEEQPFTRSLDSVVIPETIGVVYIEVHDTQSAWASQRVELDLSQAKQATVKWEMPK